MISTIPPLILAIIEKSIGHEGGYSNRKSDLGGETIWGITITTARSNGYTGAMREMSRDTAIKIYYSEYVVKPGLVSVIEISPAIGAEMFDSGINIGVAKPPVWLQEWLNAFNARGTLYPNIAEDGHIGPATRSALKNYLVKRGPEAERVMLSALNSDQANHYKRITRARAHEANEDFTYGWMRTRVAI